MHQNLFENIKHIDEEGNEYWLARELQQALKYKRWDKFKNSIDNAMVACINSNCLIDDHFSQVGKMINLAKTAKRVVDEPGPIACVVGSLPPII